nr:unnamed protein product [Digitaria exilis]
MTRSMWKQASYVNIKCRQHRPGELAPPRPGQTYDNMTDRVPYLQCFGLLDSSGEVGEVVAEGPERSSTRRGLELSRSRLVVEAVEESSGLVAIWRWRRRRCACADARREGRVTGSRRKRKLRNRATRRRESLRDSASASETTSRSLEG